MPEHLDNSLVRLSAASDLAARLGVRQTSVSRMVSLAQAGTMRDAPTAQPMGFRARQTIALQRPEFEWRARTGPFGCLTVTDALKDGRAKLEVRALGLIRIAGVTGGAMAAKGEIMRYLAELAWPPDAILQNLHLMWHVIDSETLRVACSIGSARGEIELRLDSGGRIGSVFAPDRPRKEGAGFVERPWKGRFFDYRRHEGRWLPFAGEVGWIIDGHEFVAWRGQLTHWSSY